mgnify:CR=1 FL=1
MVRLGNFIEVGNDVFMHIMAAADIRYKTVENFDFESRMSATGRTSRSPTATQSARRRQATLSFAELRLGVEFQLPEKPHAVLCCSNISRFSTATSLTTALNSTNPGGTDVFGRAPATENPGFHTERYWIDYKFQGTPATHARRRGPVERGSGRHSSGDDDPRFALFGEFGDFDVMAAAVIQYRIAALRADQRQRLDLLHVQCGL